MSPPPEEGVTGTLLLRLARPAMLPLLWCLVLLGFGVAHWDQGRPPSRYDRLWWLLVSWTCLHAGTMWANARLDRDTGPVLFGKVAQVPRVIGAATGLAMVGVLLAAGRAQLFWVGVCAAGLSMVYSAPTHPLKAHPVGGPAVNVLGYATLTPLAGYWCSGFALSRRALLLWPSVALCILALYFAAQTFQEEEDRSRGYGTFVAVFGRARTLLAVSRCLFAASVWTAVLIALGQLPRALYFCLPPVLRLFGALEEAACRADSVTEADVRNWVSMMLQVACWVVASLVIARLLGAEV